MVIWEVGEDEKAIEGLDEFGNPDPAYAAALGLVRAPFGRRAVAALIDLVVYLVLQVPYWVFTLPLLLKLYLGRISLYGFVHHPRFILALVMAGITLLFTLAFTIVQLVMHGRKGVTIGKGIMGIRSVNVKTLEKPGFWRIVLRAVVFFGSGLVVIGPIVFCLSPLFDPGKRGRGWHDLVGQVWYVDVRKGLQPYDQKRMRIARKMVTAEPVAEHKAMPSLATPTVQQQQGEYRPGGRVSAGVLGVARPHGAGPRPEVGLSGMEEPAQPSGPATPVPGKPVVGGYLRAQQAAGQHDGGSAGADLSSSSGTPAGPNPASAQPAATYRPPAPAAPEIPRPVSSGPADGMVTGTPWGPAPAEQGGPPAEHHGGRPAEQAAGSPAGAQPAPVDPPAAAPAQGQPPGAVPHPAQSPAAAPHPAQDAAPSGPPAVAAEPVAEEVEQTRMQMPGYVLYLDDGTQVPLSDAVVLGRDPSTKHHAGRAVSVVDQTRSVSKTHVALTPTDAGIEVTDLGSTNGTAVVHEGAERTLEPGIPTVALPGDTIRFGERTAVVGHS